MNRLNRIAPIRIMLALPLALVFMIPAGVGHAQDVTDPRLDRESARVAQALVDSARAERLPVKPLTGVMQEGLSRHADGPRIVRAMQDYLRALRASAGALGYGSSESEVVSGAGAVLAGVAPAALSQIRAARGKASAVVPLVVLGDLVARGVPAANAGAAVASAAKGGFGDSDFLALRQRVEQDIASGATATTALESGLRRLRKPDLAPGDSALRRATKAPTGFDDARLDASQSIGGSPYGASDLRGNVDLSLGGRSPFGISSALRVVAATPGSPDVLFQGAVMRRVGDEASGFAFGAGVRSARSLAQSWTMPVALAKGWRRIGAYDLSFDLTVGAVPNLAARSITTPGIVVAPRADSGVRFDVLGAAADTASTHPQNPVPSQPDSASRQSASRSLTSAETRLVVYRQFGGVQFQGVAGVRMSDWRGLAAWSSATAARSLSDGVGVFVGLTVGPEDMLSPMHQTRLFAGLRLEARRPRVAPVTLAEPASASTVTFRVISVDSTATFEVRAPAADMIELTGDFTDWMPIVLDRRATGVWMITRAIEPGVHRVRMRIDGAEWTPPPGLPRAPDLFGGEVGLLAISAP